VIQVGRVCDIIRYSVKSMAGIATQTAVLGWHGLAGDRRFALRRTGDDSGFPFLSASRLPELLLYHPIGVAHSTGEPLPTHIQTPSGSCLGLRSPELLAELTQRCGHSLELLAFRHGIFDEAAISVITPATIAFIGQQAGLDLDRRRFRANIAVETESDEPFVEDTWVGRTLLFGHDDPTPAIRVTLRDERCVMVDLDPATAARDARVMKTVVRLNENTAGVYATVVQCGTIRLGDAVTCVSERTGAH
jgi:hypothetical protein